MSAFHLFANYRSVSFGPIAGSGGAWHPVVMANALSLGWRALEYLPIVPALVLVGFHVIRVDAYPSQIEVTQRSCSDPANNSQLTFRQQTYCVTSAEAHEWNTTWRTEYLLMAAFAVSWGIRTVARRAKRPLT